jgi:hypothetical protein
MIHARLWLIGVLALGCGAPTPDRSSAPEVTERGTFRLRVTYEREGGLQRGANAFRVQAWDANGVAASLSEVVAEMPSHNHERSVGTIASEGDAFVVRDLWLTMPGRWQITLRFVAGARTDAALVVVFIA